MSFTFDAWTSKPGDPYISVTAHYITAPTDKPNDWELRMEQLVFKCIEERHTRKNMAHILADTLNRYKVRKKVSAII